MPGPDFFERFGWYFEQNFFDGRERARLLNDAKRLDLAPAGVVKDRPGIQDPGQRKVQAARLARELFAPLHGRLEKLQPSLEHHFVQNLRGFEEPLLLRYESGDFYAAHRDNRGSAAVPQNVSDRRLSLILFLNPPGEYEGGELVFYGLFKDSRAENFGLPLKGKAGSLIVFPSEIVHEVRPVRSGTRWTLTSWFY